MSSYIGDTKIFQVKSEFLIQSIVIYFLLLGFVWYNKVCRVGINACGVHYTCTACRNLEEKIIIQESSQISPPYILSSTLEMLAQLIKKNVNSSLLTANFFGIFLPNSQRKNIVRINHNNCGNVAAIN